MSQRAAASGGGAATEGGDSGAQSSATEDAGGATALTKIGYGLSGLVGAGIIVIGARFLVVPRAAAAGYGIATEQSNPYLAVKGVRDIASGFATFGLLAAGKPHALGRWMAAASIIPIGDAIIVLRGNGPKATAYGVHGTTAAVMLGTAALLLGGPE
jgi:hypothetical protein